MTKQRIKYLIQREIDFYKLIQPLSIKTDRRLHAVIGYVHRYKKRTHNCYVWDLTYNDRYFYCKRPARLYHFILHEIGHIKRWNAKKSEYAAEQFALRELKKRYPGCYKYIYNMWRQALVTKKCTGNGKIEPELEELLPLYGLK